MNFRRWTLVFLFSTLHFAGAAQAQNVVPIADKWCDLQDARIQESSGLASSRKYSAAELLVTHNDSGGEAKLFYVNLRGETVAEVLLNGATNIDWEDMAISGEYIYVGDIGDNLRQRESITIYRLREPQFDATKVGQKLAVVCETMTLKYPDAPCDSETLMANASSEIMLVSKNGGASRFYQTPRVFENNSTQTLEKIGEYSFTGEKARSYLATGGDLSSDETRFVIRTYTHAYEWFLWPSYGWKQVLASTPHVWELPISKQGEAICYSADALEYFISEEGVSAPIYRVEFSPLN